MAYVQGFVAAVPSANRQAYLDHIRPGAQAFRSYGATRVAHAWGDDVSTGRNNDYQAAVLAGPDETVVFGWIEYPDRATRDAASGKQMADPRMREAGDRPFDADRILLGGFQVIVDSGEGRGSYFDGCLVPVPIDRREPYRSLAEHSAALFREYGAVRVLEAWGDDVPEGTTTDFRRAVLLERGEQVVVSWIEWPSRRVRDEAWPKLMEDPRMKRPDELPFDASRMLYGGFSSILDA